MTKITFSEVLEAANKLAVEKQESLIEILRNRIRANRRYDIIKNVQETEQEFREGKCKLVTIEEILTG